MSGPLIGSWMEAGFGGGALVAGLALLLTLRRKRRRSERAPAESQRGLASEAESVRSRDAAADVLRTLVERPHSGRPGADPVLALLATAIREPLRQLRRSVGTPPEALHQLEQIAWRMRMLGAAPRPMQAKLTSPISLLQQAAEEVPLLRDTVVVAAWSLLSRQPIHVDEERARLAFREVLSATARACGEGGKLAIRILPGSRSGLPVQIEFESGRPGTEADALAFLVAKHLLEDQGGQVELDGRITRIHLRGTAPKLPEPNV